MVKDQENKVVGERSKKKTLPMASSEAPRKDQLLGKGEMSNSFLLASQDSGD